MGVSGSGKTTIANGIAARLGWSVLEGDKFHPPANIEKMSHGIPLTDEDRWPWLRAIGEAIDRTLAAHQSAVVACSTLKRSYRTVLIGDRRGVDLIYLKGSFALISERMARRKGHFMPPALLKSQFDTLEEPGPDENPIVADITPPPAAIVDDIIAQMRQRRLVA